MKSEDLVTLRRATMLDSEFCYAVRKVSMILVEPDWNEEMEAFIQACRFERLDYRIIEADGLDVGVVATRAPTSADLHLCQLFLLPGDRGRGIGSECVRQLIREAGERILTVNVRKDNPRARAFYEQLGFREMDDIDTHIRLRWTSRESDGLAE